MPRSTGILPRTPALRAIAAFAVVALAAASILALLARIGWPFELFVHFRPQYAALGAFAAVTCLLLRLPLLAAAGATVALFNAALFYGTAGSVAQASSCTEGPLVTVVTANAWYRNEDMESLLRWLEASPADIVVVQEVTPKWAAALSRLAKFPYRELHPRNDPYGIAVLSRHALESAARRDLAGDGLPSLDVVLEVEGQMLRVLGLHTRWPLLPGLAKRRNQGLAAAADLVRTSQVPAVVAGDLNLTPWAPVFADFLQRSGLRDPLGRSLHPTWFAGFWPLALRIDHVLVPGEFCTVDAEVGPDVGSDHRPVVVTLRRLEEVSPPEPSRQ